MNATPITCVHCGFANSAEARFCGRCGRPPSPITPPPQPEATTATCAFCGSRNPVGATFCGECGRALGGPPLVPVVTDERPGRGRGLFVVALVFGLLFLLAGGAWLVWAQLGLGQSDDDPAPTAVAQAATETTVPITKTDEPEEEPVVTIPGAIDFQATESSLGMNEAATMTALEMKYPPPPVLTEESEIFAEETAEAIRLTSTVSSTSLITSQSQTSLPPTTAPNLTLAPQPTGTVLPSPAVSNTPIPSLIPGTPTIAANTATPANNAASGSLTLEDFNSGNSSQIIAAYRINAPGNDLNLSLAPSAAGGQALAMNYSINNAPPSDYAGIESDRMPMDWRNYSEVCLWVQNDGFNGHLVFQFREQAGDTWKTAVQLGNIVSRTICLPLNTSTFWNFSGTANASMDLNAIDNFAIYLGEGGIDQGTLLIDSIRLDP